MNCKRCGTPGEKKLCTGENKPENKDKIYYVCPNCPSKDGRGKLWIGFEIAEGGAPASWGGAHSINPASTYRNLSQSQSQLGARVTGFSELAATSRRLAELQSSIAASLEEMAGLAKISKDQMTRSLISETDKIKEEQNFI